ncbi:methylated-DNA--[protein]-cysteine S-methyltransferase [Archaeoglobus sp.]
MFSVFWEDIYFNVLVENGAVVRAFFSKKPAFSTEGGEFREQIEEYFDGKRVEFNIPVRLKVPPFTEKVLAEVSKIPYGRTAAYSEIAKKLNTSPRAVGQAVKRNPVPVIIPCHRVVAKGGLGGYSAFDIKIKERLLKLEKSI